MACGGLTLLCPHVWTRVVNRHGRILVRSSIVILYLILLIKKTWLIMVIMLVKVGCVILTAIQSGDKELRRASVIMPFTVKMSENGNTGRIVRISGNLILPIILILLLFSKIEANETVLNCYDTTKGNNGFYYIKTKFVDLDLKRIAFSIDIAPEGELVNLKPAQIARQNDTLLISAVDIGCYCKNTAPRENYTHLAFLSKASRNLLAQRDLPNHMLSELLGLNENEVFIRGSRFEGQSAISMDGIYIFRPNHNLERIRDVNIDFYPHTKVILGPDELAQEIGNNAYFDVFDGHYYLIRLGENGIVEDTIRLESFESRNMIFALKDTILYAFSLNYEIHFKGESYKGYGQDWINPNLRRFNINTFELVDSLPLLDYPEGDFISGSYGVGEVIGPYITYYFGEPGDMHVLYPAMLLIFDTRTNEATWLRVGWR